MTDIKPELVMTDLPDASPSDPMEALSWLGETIEEVAEGLRARGIKGRRRESEFCALAVYLQTWWKDARVACGTYWLESTIYNHPCPPACESFELLFDDGAFPDLIAD